MPVTASIINNGKCAAAAEENQSQTSLINQHADFDHPKIESIQHVIDDNDHGKQQQSSTIFYKVEQNPPWPATLLFSFQQLMVCAGGLVSMPIIIANLICAQNNLLARVKLIGTTLVTAGFSTILQSSIGSRLPLLQGPSAAFIPPVIALMRIDEFACSVSNITNSNHNSSSQFQSLIEEDENVLWMSRMTLVQGGLITASLAEILIGATGIIGVISGRIGPLTIAPLMILLATSLLELIQEYVTKHAISSFLVVLLIVFTLYLPNVKIPILLWNRQQRWHVIWFPLFAMFPYILAISMAWFLCFILTVSEALSGPTHQFARTDQKSQIIIDAPWFRIPYPGSQCTLEMCSRVRNCGPVPPDSTYLFHYNHNNEHDVIVVFLNVGQWGMPSLNAAVFVGMVAGTICSILESVGDYHACARVTQEPSPPIHAVNRGIMVEGLCCFIGGFLGGGTSVTTYSENIGVIGITGVACRVCMIVAGVLMIILGVFTKFGAIIAAIPDPLIGATLLVSIAMVAGVGISSVQLLDLKLTRNLAILGLSIMFGTMIPRYIREHSMNTGYTSLDQIVNILFSTDMIVGGAVGFLLDNTAPGATRQQRGLSAENHQSNNFSVSKTTTNNDHHHNHVYVNNKQHQQQHSRSIYDFPDNKLTLLLDRFSVLQQYLPFMPNYGKTYCRSMAANNQLIGDKFITDSFV